MSVNNRVFSPGVRKRKAYWTSFVVLLSYYWLNLKSKFRGKNYYDNNINALHKKNATRIKVRVQELQGLFIKFGQLISNLSNILPEEFRQPLEELQDHITAKPFSEIKQTIKDQLGKSPHELFTDFDETALAAASIGQVHRAKVGTEEVVVKIQHANIDTIAHADLEILQNLVKLHGIFMDMKGLDHTYEQVKIMIEEELDYTKEATSMQQITKNLEDDPELDVFIPKVFPKLSTSKVLVSTFCEGTKIANTPLLKEWGIDREDIAKRLIELWCKMILVDGFYHADPHPGNILVDKEGKIILLDFGAVAQLNPKMKEAIPKLIEGIIRNDTEDTVAALQQMGFLGTDNASRKYVEKLIEIFKTFIQEEVQFDGMNFQNVKLNSGLGSIASILRKVDLRDVSNNIQVPKDYILLNRTVVLLAGNSFLLAPDMDTLNVVRPYIKNHVLSKEDSFVPLIVNTFKTQMTTALSIPNELSRYLKTANRGEQELEINGLESGIQKLHNLGQQFLYFGIIITAIYFLMNYFTHPSSIWRTVIQIILGLSSFLFVRAFFKGMKK